MTTKTLMEIVKDVRDIPSLPTIVIDLLNCIDQDDAGAKTLAEKISLDQALTAKTLRIANSSFYGMPRKVATIQQAISILGFDSVRTLVASVAMLDSFSIKGGENLKMATFWQQSVCTAICAKLLAKHMHADSGQAFVAGLLHDIGRLILVLSDPDRYADTLKYQQENKCHIRMAERKVLGFDHAEVGRELAELWRLPQSIQTAIGAHHEANPKKDGQLATVVQAADKMTCSLVENDEELDIATQNTSDILKMCGINEKTFKEVFDDTKVQFDEIAGFLVS
jgi:putative nucleotidyltransferase with HDIG domain